MRYFMRLSYNGAAFSGWQIQPNAPSVQETLEKALTTLCGENISVVGAGRTDAGVNARDYIAHFDCSNVSDDGLLGKAALTPQKLCFKLNAILPRQVAVHDIYPVADDMHARFSATLREYKYYIHNRKNPFLEEFSWYCRFPLDIERMNKACNYLPGVHDCSCFEKKGSDNATSICEIFEACWQNDTNGLVFTVSANRFLRNMVRAIVGTMVDIGRGVHEPEYILQLFDGGSRSDAGQSVPAHGLFLTKVGYPSSENQKK